jgi:hypothetical protein
LDYAEPAADLGEARMPLQGFGASLRWLRRRSLG